MAITPFLNRTYRIERATNVDDSYGSITQVWAELFTKKGRMRVLMPMERAPVRIALGKEGLFTSHRLYLLGAPSVQVTDRAVDETVDGTYFFCEINNPGNVGEHLEIDCWKEEA